jgi:hypothetical protein
MAGRDVAGRGGTRRGLARQARHGTAGPVAASPGTERQGRLGLAWQGWFGHGTVGHVAAGKAGRGLVGQGESRQARRGAARHGQSRLGWVGHGKARQGRQFIWAPISSGVFFGRPAAAWGRVFVFTAPGQSRIEGASRVLGSSVAGAHPSASVADAPEPRAQLPAPFARAGRLVGLTGNPPSYRARVRGGFIRGGKGVACQELFCPRG